MTSTTIPVGGERPYDVLVGRDLLGALPGLLPGAAQAAVLYAPPLKDYATRVADVVESAVAVALRQGARVETVTQDGRLQALDGIGALLRF